MGDWNKEKNDLTWKLFEAGYTPENHPAYVRWDSTHYEFEYTSEFVRQMVLESPCGLLMKGTDFNGYMSYMGINWRLENNNSVHRCPHNKADCELNHEYLRRVLGHKIDIVQCAFHKTDKPYNYKNSYEKIWDDYDAMQEQKRKEFFSRLKWNPEARYCNCIKWDDKKQTWQAEYDPWQCVRGCQNNICVLTGKKLDGKKANVFYNVKTTTEYRKGFIVEPIISIKKGVKLFEVAKEMTILEAYIKAYPDAPLQNEMNKQEHSKPLFFAEHHEEKYKLEILNVRIERRETRDLLQDLQDAREGITVYHASDVEKAVKQAKRERKEKAKDAKERKRVKNLKTILSDNTNSEVLKNFAIKELKKRGIDEVVQLSFKDILNMEGEQ